MFKYTAFMKSNEIKRIGYRSPTRIKKHETTDELIDRIQSRLDISNTIIHSMRHKRLESSFLKDVNESRKAMSKRSALVSLLFPSNNDKCKNIQKSLHRNIRKIL